MDDLTAFERQIAAEVQRGAGLPEPVDDRAVYQAVIAVSRQKRWGFDMFSALKLTAAGVVMALFGGFLLMSVASVPPGEPVIPAAVTASPSPLSEDQRRVSGREVIDALMEQGSTVTQWGHLTQHRAWVQTLSIAMDDPWANGTGRYVSNADIIGASPDGAGNMRGGVARERGTLRIENEGGAWEGPCDGFTQDSGAHIVGSCVLAGSGDYEGYTYLHLHEWGTGGATEGVIFAGDYPDAYPTLPPKPGS